MTPWYRTLVHLVQSTVACLTLSACLIQPARALDFTADLTSIKVEAEPGQVANRRFTLTLAKTEQTTRFKVKVEDWWRSEDGKQSFFQPAGTLKRSCAPWVKLNPVEASVDPGKQLDVRLSIAVPRELKPGGYWCVLTIDEVPDPNKIVPQGVGIRFNASISVGIFVYIGALDKTCSITGVQMDPKSAAVTLKNEGNCPVGVEGRIEFLKPGETQPTATSVIPRSTVLPEPSTTAQLRTTLPDAKALPDGTYLVRVILDTGLAHYIGVQKEMVLRREVHDTNSKP